MIVDTSLIDLDLVSEVNSMLLYMDDLETLIAKQAIQMGE